MKFENFTRHLAGSLNVTVDARALHLMWGAGSGPQDAEGIIDANWSMISSIAFDKVTNGDLEADGSVVITEADMDGDEGEDFFRVIGAPTPIQSRADVTDDGFAEENERPSAPAKEIRELTVERWFGDIADDDVPW